MASIIRRGFSLYNELCAPLGCHNTDYHLSGDHLENDSGPRLGEGDNCGFLGLEPLGQLHGHIPREGWAAPTSPTSPVSPTSHISPTSSVTPTSPAPYMFARQRVTWKSE